jgi:ribosomal protein S18 acetylase RimI-like enzyme
MSDVVVRKCTVEDLPQVVPIYEEFVAYHAKVDSYFRKVAEHGAMFEAWMQAQIDAPDARVLVAEATVEKNGRPQLVGYGLGRLEENPPVYPDPRHGYVANIGVAESWQRNGVGELLFEELRRWFLEQGVRRVELFAALGNPKSTRFWRKMGFKPFTERMYLKL